MKQTNPLDETAVTQALTDFAEHGVPSRVNVMPAVRRKLSEPKPGFFAPERLWWFAPALALTCIALVIASVIASSARGRDAATSAAKVLVPADETTASTPTAQAQATLALSLTTVTPAANVQAVDLREQLRIENGKGQAFFATWSPDGKFITVSSFAGIDLYDANTLQEARQLKPENPWLNLSFNTDGSQLVTRGYLDLSGAPVNHFSIWDVPSGQVISNVVAGSQLGALSRDGKWLATVYSTGLRVWDAQTQQPRFASKADEANAERVSCFYSPTAGRYEIAFSPDNQLVACATYDSVDVWDALTGELKQRLAWQERASMSGNVAWSADSKRIAASNQKQLAVWDVETGQMIQKIALKITLIRPAEWIALSPDGSQVAYFVPPPGGAGAPIQWKIAIHDVASGLMRHELEGHRNYPGNFEFSPDGKRLLVNKRDVVEIWDVASGELTGTLNGYAGYTFPLLFSSNGAIIAAGNMDKGTTIWDAGSGQLVRRLGNAQWNIPDIALSQDGSKAAILNFASGERGTQVDWRTQVFDVKTGQLLQEFQGGQASIAFMSDGKSIVLGEGFGVTQVNIDTGSVERKYDSGASSAFATQTVFNAAATRAAVGGRDGTIIVWDVDSGERLRTITNTYILSDAVSQSPPSWLALSADGKVLMSASYWYGINVWDVENGTLISSVLLDNHERGTLNAAALSPDGTRVAFATSSGSYQIKLWDVVNRQLLVDSDPRGHHFYITALAFSPDSARLASASRDGTIRIWDVHEK